MLDLNRVKTLVTVAEEGSIACAAQRLSYVPSAVSQQIQQLERDVGAELTERVGRGIVFTDAGRLLVDQGRELLQQASAAEASVRALLDLDGGRVRVAAFQSAALAFAAKALGETVRRYPQLEVSLVVCEPVDSIPALRRYEVDVVLVYSYDLVPFEADEGLQLLNLARDEMRLVLPDSHQLANNGANNGVALQLASLRDECWVCDAIGTPAHKLLRRACLAAGFEPDIRFTTEDYGTALRLVREHLCVALLPTLAIEGYDENVTIRDLEPPPGRDVMVAWRESDRSEAVELFVSLLEGRVGAATDPRREVAGAR